MTFNPSLPYTPGVPPPSFPPGPAVGFSASSETSQVAAVTANGRANKFPVNDTPVEIISDAITGTAVICLLGGAPVWIGFTNNITPDTNDYRLIAGQPVTVQPVVQVWAVGLNSPDVPDSTVQVILVEAQ